MNTPPPELANLLPNWQLVEPLTKTTALEILKQTFAAGYTDYDLDTEVGFGEEDLDWHETLNEVDLTDFRGALSAAQLASLNEVGTCKSITWRAAVALCGELRRTCLRIERDDEVLLLSPEEGLDEYTDRTFGPMWEGW
jgi:hypothetical protein